MHFHRHGKTDQIAYLSLLNGRRRSDQKHLKHRSQEDQQIIRKAKELLMARNSFTEEEAHKYIQKRSMDNGTGLVEVAQMILSLLQEG